MIPACSSVSNWSTPVASGSNWQSSVTCSTTESSSGTGAFSASYTGGNYVSSSQANLGQTNTLTPSYSYGANSQTNAGGCTSCYYGESSTPDAEGDAFVSGALSGQLTIGTANNVIITGSLTYADCSGNWTTGQSGEAGSFCPYNVGGTNDSLGLIANNYAEVNHPVTNAGGSVLPGCGANAGVLCDPANGGSGLTIDAAILALTQSFVVNNYAQGSTEGQLNLYGSIQQYARGPVGTFSGSSSVSGYVKHYTWNPLMGLVSPPSYLVPSTAPWVPHRGRRQRRPAFDGHLPAALRDLPRTGTGHGHTVSQYCSQATGGLPGYPAITAPSAPTNVNATAAIGGTATITWTDPPNNGSPITNYGIQSIPACPACVYSSLSGASVASATVTGLTPGTAYIFTVTATNAYGTSDASNPSPSVTAPASRTRRPWYPPWATSTTP